MFSLTKFIDCYKASLKVVNLYDILTDILIREKGIVDEFRLFVDELENAIKVEDVLYDNLTLEETRKFMIELKNITSDEGILFSDIRVNNRLSYVINKLRGYTLENKSLFPTLDYEYELDLIDLIDSKFVIDTYKLLNKKLNSLTLSDSKSLKMSNMIDKLNAEHIIYKVSLYILAEKLSINSMFNISCLPLIDLDLIKNRFVMEKELEIDIDELINSRAYSNILSLLDGFSRLEFNGDDYVSVYDNLVYCTEFEVLFEYLTLEQLKEVSIRLNEINLNNKLVIDKVRMLAMNKINNYYK